MKRITIALLSMGLSANAFANSQSHDIEVTASTLTNDYIESYFSFGGKYFFEPRQAKGPKGYYGFNPRHDWFGVSYFSSDSGAYENSAFDIMGNFNLGNFQISAQLSNTSSEYNFYNETNESSSLILGVDYFITDKWSVSGYFGGTGSDTIDAIGESEVAEFIDTRYELTIGDSHSIGFSLGYDFEDNDAFLGVNYFTQFSNGQYLEAFARISDYYNDRYGATFYFNDDLSVGVATNELEVSEANASLFFSNNYQVKVYISGLDYSEQTFGASISGYF